MHLGETTPTLDLLGRLDLAKRRCLAIVHDSDAKGTEHPLAFMPAALATAGRFKRVAVCSPRYTSAQFQDMFARSSRAGKQEHRDVAVYYIDALSRLWPSQACHKATDLNDSCEAHGESNVSYLELAKNPASQLCKLIEKWASQDIPSDANDKLVYIDDLEPFLYVGIDVPLLFVMMRRLAHLAEKLGFTVVFSSGLDLGFSQTSEVSFFCVGIADIIISCKGFLARNVHDINGEITAQDGRRLRALGEKRVEASSAHFKISDRGLVFFAKGLSRSVL